MGGKLLNKIFGLPEKRLSKEEFLGISNEIISKSKSLCPNLKIGIIPWFKNKENFSDLDLLCEVINHNNPWIAFAKNISDFNPHVNGGIISFPYKEFQVDLITVGSENYETSRNYYNCENGNFLGRLAYNLGLRYKHSGLYLNLPLSYWDKSLPENQFKEILITKDLKQIFNILGFNLEKFYEGFNNENEMYEWIINSYYFHPSYFKFESLNHQNRTRNKKRPIYQKFVEICEKEDENSYLIQKPNMLDLVLHDYPEIKNEIEKVREEILIHSERKKKFNGKIINEVLGGLEGEKLGKFIISFKRKHQNFNEFLDNHNQTEIYAEILNHYSNFYANE